ncbi:probable insulin-like peptide 2 [Drosophila tropicalis]|uniref:probable insulin-like peptide 2 n=1 Tax=Drosophila tropicalis TaxID=46794 RepID=UPI0035AB9E27
MTKAIPFSSLAFVLLGLCTVLAFVANASASSNAVLSNENVVLCSARLNEMMSMVCREFNSIIPGKRSSSNIDIDPLDPLQFIEEKESAGSSLSASSSEFLPYPLNTGRYYQEGFNSLAALRRRQRREGIVDRCCKQSCPVSYLNEYCSISM